MGLVRSALAPSARASVGNTSGIATPEKWVEEWFSGGGATAAGVWISEETALYYSPFFAGVNAIATDVGKLPLPLYERLDEKAKRKVLDHPVARVLREPNPLMPPMAFRRTLQGHSLTWGTGYAYIVADERENGPMAGQPVELWPLRPDRLHPDVKAGSKPGEIEVRWLYSDPVNGITRWLYPEDLLRIGGLGFDGIRGYSLVQMARQSLGLGVALERYGSSFFGNGARPGGVLKHPKKLSDPAYKRLQTEWENDHQGLDKAQRVAILEEGLEWQDIGIPPDDAQFLETRKLQVTEAARWLRIPPHKIGDLDRATFSNIEHQSLEYLADTLLGWLTTWEQSVNGRLLLPKDRERYFVEHIVDAITRTDIERRYKAYAIGRNWGWLSADDVRAKENENPLPDNQGEVYLVPLNTVPAGEVAEPSGPSQEQEFA